ncbi:hypothetical protein E2C01_089830 [Portunus trituberculatus]|uniref:Uncharacterized protein n=1 Tax=Portunus trituberculatus TaxID=210409 RepID=A0A5B7JEN7_PORTR|nr:hypothetical protein [Portunus trituberculatus]
MTPGRRGSPPPAALPC